MDKNMIRAACLLLLAAGLAGCAGGRLKLGPTDGGEVVEAEGWTPLEGVGQGAEGLLDAKRRSLVEAQKKAIERTVGVYISAKTRVAQAVTLNQNILAKVEGYIKSFEVKKEWQEDGFHKTRIWALVRYQKVGEDLRALGLIRPEPPPGNPNVVVVMATKGPYPEDRDGRASAGVRQGLLKRGFKVVDRNDVTADLVIRGEAEVHPMPDVRLGGFYSYRARVSLEVVKPGTGEVIGSKVQEVSQMDPVPEIAAAKALEQAGQMAGDILGGELSDSLQHRIRLTLRVAGLQKLDEVESLAEDLRTQPDIAFVTLAEFRPAGAEYSVTTEGMAGDQLGALLMSMKKYRLQASSVTPYLVEVSVAR